MESGNYKELTYEMLENFFKELEENQKNRKDTNYFPTFLTQQQYEIFDKALKEEFEKKYKNSIDLEDKSNGE